MLNYSKHFIQLWGEYLKIQVLLSYHLNIMVFQINIDTQATYQFIQRFIFFDINEFTKYWLQEIQSTFMLAHFKAFSIILSAQDECCSFHPDGQLKFTLYPLLSAKYFLTLPRKTHWIRNSSYIFCLFIPILFQNWFTESRVQKHSKSNSFTQFLFSCSYLQCKNHVEICITTTNYNKADQSYSKREIF